MAADDQQQNDNQPDPQQQNSGDGGGDSGTDAAAEKFWKQMDERLDAAIARGVQKHVPRAKPGTQRTGRTTLPEMIAQFMGGPFAPERDKKS